MERHLILGVFATIVLPLAGCFHGAEAAAQVDPNAGRALSLRFKSDEQRVQVLRNRMSMLEKSEGYDRTYDARIISENFSACGFLGNEAKDEIYRLDYDRAARDLTDLEGIVQATKTILGEDISMPMPQLEKESTLNDTYAPSDDLPRFSGPATRAAIASEISFSQRVVAKARVPAPFPGAGNGVTSNPTPCAVARNSMVEQEADSEKKLGYADPGDFGEPNSFFSMAEAELRTLHYSTAHQLARWAYLHGQKILALCSTKYGSSNPPSVIVQGLVPRGEPGPGPSTQSSEQPKRIEISAAEAAQRLVVAQAPTYPPVAIYARVSGTVELRVIVSTTGTVEELEVIRGPSPLQQAALDAVRTWRYKPYLLDNTPVEVETTVNVVFSLSSR